ncbi:MAG: diacylglycerol/lipid kinase family protein [Fidelibacterota bacterium]
MSKKHYHVILNPASGSGISREILNTVRPDLEKEQISITVHESEDAGHSVELARALDLDGADGIITIGGDGTLHEVINGLMTREDGKKVPVGAIPGGSGNSFLYGLDIKTPADGVQALRRGMTRKIDIARVSFDGQILYSFNIIGWGLVVDIEMSSERFRWWPKQRYNLATILELITLKSRHTNLVLDGVETDLDVAFLIACNTPYTGVGMKMAPRADLQDGLIDLVIVKEATRLQMLKLFPKVFDGSHIESDLVDYRQVSAFGLIPDEEAVINIDGELNAHTPLKVEMIPQGIEILV